MRKTSRPKTQRANPVTFDATSFKINGERVRYGQEGQRYLKWMESLARRLGVDVPVIMCEGGAEVSPELWQAGARVTSAAAAISYGVAEFCLALMLLGSKRASRAEREPPPADHPLRHLPNVRLTPHAAGVVAENRFRIGTFVADEIEAFVNGRPIYEVTEKQLANMA